MNENMKSVFLSFVQSDASCSFSLQACDTETDLSVYTNQTAHPSHSETQQSLPFPITWVKVDPMRQTAEVSELTWWLQMWSVLRAAPSLKSIQSLWP